MQRIKQSLMWGSMIGLLVLLCSFGMAQTPPNPGPFTVDTRYVSSTGWSRFTPPSNDKASGATGPNRRVATQGYTAITGTVSEPSNWSVNPNPAHANSPGIYYGVSGNYGRGSTITDAGFTWESSPGNDLRHPLDKGWLMFLRVTIVYKKMLAFDQGGSQSPGSYSLWINTKARVDKGQLGSPTLTFQVNRNGSIILSSTQFLKDTQLGPVPAVWPTMGDTPWSVGALPDNKIDSSQMIVRRVICISQAGPRGAKIQNKWIKNPDATLYGASGHSTYLSLDGSYAYGYRVQGMQVGIVNPTSNIVIDWYHWESLFNNALLGNSTPFDVLLPGDRKKGYKWPIDFSIPRQQDKNGTYIMTPDRFGQEVVNIDLRPKTGVRAH